MIIEQDIIDTAAKQLAAEIDISVMKNLGYYKNVEFVRSTGTVFGHPYHTVGPRTGWQSRRMWDDMMLWMVATFGPTAKDGVWTLDQRWYANNAKFWFRDEKDLAWFMLRWS
jgi:hypothetical protein